MRSRASRHLAVAVGLTGAVVFAASPALAGADRARAEGPFTTYSPDVPSGARARVDAVYNAAGATIVTLHVWGLRPDTEYGAHAHVNPCGVTGAAAGPHWQRVPDPVTPSVNPAYANPGNEIWLDLTTDDEGNGVARSKQDWQFPPDHGPRSVVLHAQHTSTAPGTAGTAGARLGCLSVDF
jgi:Cu-Zn family superoxide dismutase